MPRYTDEYKWESVALFQELAETGSVFVGEKEITRKSDLAKELGISTYTLYNWVDKIEKEDAEPEKENDFIMDAEVEKEVELQKMFLYEEDAHLASLLAQVSDLKAEVKTLREFKMDFEKDIDPRFYDLFAGRVDNEGIKAVIARSMSNAKRELITGKGFLRVLARGFGIPNYSMMDNAHLKLEIGKRFILDSGLVENMTLKGEVEW